MRNIIEAKNITLVKNKQKILDCDYFSLKKSETTALIGPNGAGKSTLLQVLMLLQRPTNGDLYFDGEKVDWKDAIEYRRHMAIMFQEPLLLDTTVYSNIASGLKIRGVPKKEIEPRVKHWINRLDIEHLTHRSVKYLSGGEAQRVSLARALVLEPKVLFLDEPFSALDAPTRSALISDFAVILQDAKISCVFVTHDYSELLLLAQNVVALEKGKIIQAAAPHEILVKPSNLTAASLVGVDNIIPGKVLSKSINKTVVEIGTHTITVSDNSYSLNDNIYILIRSEDIRISVNTEEENSLGGKITRLIPFGYQYKAVVDCGFPLIMLLNSDQVLSGDIAGRSVKLNIKPEKIHLIKKD